MNRRSLLSSVILASVLAGVGMKLEDHEKKKADILPTRLTKKLSELFTTAMIVFNDTPIGYDNGYYVFVDIRHHDRSHDLGRWVGVDMQFYDNSQGKEGILITLEEAQRLNKSGKLISFREPNHSYAKYGTVSEYVIPKGMSVQQLATILGDHTSIWEAYDERLRREANRVS